MKSTFPLSHGQQALWIAHESDPTSDAYNIITAFRIRFGIDIVVLRRVLEKLVERHESLRTVFGESNGRTVQRVLDVQALDFRAIDDCRQDWDGLKTVLLKEGKRPFDLERGPLMRVRLYTTTPTEHFLLAAFHHIIVDARSLGILMDDFVSLYHTESLGAPPSLEPVKVGFDEYVQYEHNLLTSQTGKDLVKYWHTELKGELPRTTIIADVLPGQRRATGTGITTFSLGDELSVKLRAVARLEQTSLYVTLLAALQVLLSRYTREDEVLIACPTAGRTEISFQEIVGFFVNPVLVRGNLSGDPTFRQFLRKVKKTLTGAVQHQSYPFSLVAAELQSDRTSRSVSSTDVLFNFLRMRRYGLVSQGGVGDGIRGETLGLRSHSRLDLGSGSDALILEPVLLEQPGGQFPLEIQIMELDRSLSCTIHYDAGVFFSNTIDRFVRTFQTLLGSISANPNESVRGLMLQSISERNRILVEWNSTKADYARDVCIHQLIERQAERTPEAVALVYEAQQFTYRELNHRANAIAHMLVERRIKPEDRVGLCLRRSPLMVIAMIGVLKSGGAYIPLDPDLPAERLAYFLEDSGVSIVLTEEDGSDRLPSGIEQIVIEGLKEAVSERGEGLNPDVKLKPDSLAYIMYTSGSTGVPKGVAVTHRNLVHSTAARSLFYKEHPTRFLLLSPFMFDSSVAGIYWSLSQGGALIVLTDETVRDPALIAEAIEKNSATHVLGLPSLYAQVVKASRQIQLQSLRTVIVAGESLFRETVDIHLARAAHAALFNEYGPTEGTVWATAYRVEGLNNKQVVPVGRPIPNGRVYILDDYLEPVPVGVPGELYVGGDGVVRGYWNRPDLTEASFLANPFLNDAGERLYRTGDLGRYLTDGNIEFLGRRDEQLKIRGYRVEPGEIEATLKLHPDIHDGVVVVRGQDLNQRRLVAYVIPRSGHVADTKEIRAFLEERLPAYMIPSTCVLIDAFPLTASGKIDRRGLPDPSPISPAPSNLSPLEALLASIWSEVLGVVPTSGSDDFFDLGGHSLLGTQVASRIRERLHVDLPLRAIFEARTLADLAVRIQAGQNVFEVHSTIPPLRPASRDRHLPLSFAQERMWFLHQLAPQSAAYNMETALRISGEIDRTALRKCWYELVRRHESLRTTFAAVDGIPVQRIDVGVSIELPEIDLQQMGRGDREEAAARILEDEARKPFDLSTGPLLRLLLLRIDEQEWFLSIVMHHIISDNWSIALLGRELAVLYNGFCRGQEVNLTPPALHYADFAIWQRQWLTGEVLAAKLAYWREQLTGIKLLDLPTDRPRPALQSHQGALVKLDLSAPLFDRLSRLSHQHNATMFITLLAAFKALLHRYTGQDDLVVGTPVANRNHLEIEGMMGTFVNTLVIRSDVSGDPTFVEHVKRVREVVLGAFVHQDMPFEKLVEELQPERDTTRPPLVQVLFNVPNAPLHGIKFNGLQWSPVEVDRKSAQFDLSLSVDTELTHSVFLEYNTDLFEAESMKRLLGHFRNILEAIANDPECRISRLSVLSEQERAQILREWNSTDTEYRADSSIHDLFEHQSHSTPDAIALSFEGKNVSYSELDARSNQLAHVLLKKGVGPGVRVAVYMNRSIELVVALLGILKAGGAYVPIDSGQPIRRVAFYLADSGAQIVVTQSDLVKTLPANHAVSVIVDGNRSEIASESREKPRSSVTSRDIAYVIYTSGSTGEPKGVEIEHRSVVNFLASMQSLPGISASDVLLSVTTPSFDIAGLEIYLPLVTGARIVIAGEEDARDGRRLIDLLQKTSATMMQATPSTWEMLVNVGWKGNPQLKILCGGEPLSRRLADALLERGSSVWNMYGPTETTIWSSVARVMPGVNPIDIGKPIANTELYVLDGHMQPLPVGIPGELYIGGDGLARGYLNRPELTAAKFIPHPFSAKEGARLYRTGDRAKFLASGSVLCLGRTDDQVKVRGHRIEPGEIESAICRLPMVSRACVVSAAGSTGDSRLVAYVVLANEGVLSSTQLRENLAQILPDYMLPADVVFLRHLPLTPSGKVDKKKLPLPEELVDNVTDGYVAPRDPLELQLVGVWEEVLGRRRIGIRDNFFDLGGHSLISARLFPMVERRTGKALPWATLFEAPTIEKFAAVLRQEGWNPSWSSLVAIQPGGSKPPFYVVHGADGEVIEYLGLARFFGKEQPLYALQAQGLDGKKPRHATIEEMANHYITEIRTLQPRGPYFLGGACVGGYLALEMAQQLLAQGEGVGLLALIDSYAPGYPKLNPEVGRLVRILSRLKYRGGMHWRNIRVLKGAERWFYIKFWSAEYRRAAIAKLKMIRKKAGVTEVRKSNASPYSLYVPKPYPDKLWVFAASEHPSAEIADPCHGWSDFAVAGVEVHEIPGHDGAIRFEPSVRILAQKILHCLSEAQEKTTVSAERSVMPENPVRPSDATS